MPAQDKVTIAVPVYNGEDRLQLCLNAIKKTYSSSHELLVIDDGSDDNTSKIAQKYGKVIRHEKRLGSAQARATAAKNADGDIIVFIDSDIIVQEKIISRAIDHLNNNDNLAAVTGLLAVEHPNENFPSQYKNIYMHFVFSQLPLSVNFLYGSIFAIRKTDFPMKSKKSSCMRFGVDTALGLSLKNNDHEIRFCRDLEVIHLKKHTIFTLCINDFRVPFNWGRLFILHSGWKSLFRGQTGYCHSPRWQLLALLALAFLGIGILLQNIGLCIISFVCWFLFNRLMLVFMWKTKGSKFGLMAGIWTFLDQYLMGTGAFCGIVYGAIEVLTGRKRKI